MDYYKILNVKEDASLKEIEQAYQDLSSFYNPENNISPLAYKKFREINKAYVVLKEIKQRELYNLVKEDNKIEVTNKQEGKAVTLKDFYKESYDEPLNNIENFKDAIVEDEYSNYKVLNYRIPYLYYLLECDYEVEYLERKIISYNEVCPSCKGIGKVKENNKVVYCKDCLSSGYKVTLQEEKRVIRVKVDKKIIDKENKLIIEFDFFDKDNYKVNGNEINCKYVVSEEEYYNGVNLKLFNDKDNLFISDKEFNEPKKYIFLDKVINLEYVLTAYKGKDKKGYILTDKEEIYLNLKDFTYSFKSNDNCNYKVILKDKIIKLEGVANKGYNKENGDLILEVIRIENNSDLKVFFDLKIVKVSPFVFKLKGKYKEHRFNNKKLFDYDDKYLYLPSLAYTLKLKNYFVFNFIFVLGYVFVPLVLFIILGVSSVFFIASFIYLIVYLGLVNFLMEVRV